MSNTNTGGPAFPFWSDSDGLAQYSGMTLRDYFAAKAMQGLMGRVWGDLPTDELFTVWSKSAYAMADAMLKAREA
jgi:hypothetical protein